MPSVKELLARKRAQFEAERPEAPPIFRWTGHGSLPGVVEITAVHDASFHHIELDLDGKRHIIRGNFWPEIRHHAGKRGMQRIQELVGTRLAPHRVLGNLWRYEVEG